MVDGGPVVGSSRAPLPPWMRWVGPLLAGLVLIAGAELVVYNLAGGGAAPAPARRPAAVVSGAPVGAGTLPEGPVPVDVLGLRFELPAGWFVSAPGASVDGVGLFPGDERLASAFDRNLAIAVESGAVLFGFDTEPGADALLQVVLFPTDAGDPLLAATEAGRTTFASTAGVTIERDEPVDLAEGTGHRFRYRFMDGTVEAIGIQLLVPADGQVFVVTFSTDDPAIASELDDVAATVSAG